jgi:hypothetical protein
MLKVRLNGLETLAVLPPVGGLNGLETLAVLPPVGGLNGLETLAVLPPVGGLNGLETHGLKAHAVFWGASSPGPLSG